MNSIIQAMVICTVMQIIAMFGMSAYIYDRSTEQAKSYAVGLVQHHRSEVQQQFSDERESMKSFVLTTVEREVSKVVNKQTK